MKYTLWFVPLPALVSQKKPLVSIIQVCSDAEHVMNYNMTRLLQITLWQQPSQLVFCYFWARNKNKGEETSNMKGLRNYEKFSVKSLANVNKGSMSNDNLSLTECVA